MAAIHHRSPVIVPPEAFDAWLDPAAEPATLRGLLRPPPDDFLEMIRLGDAVNKVANDGPELQQPFDPASAPKPPEQKPAMRSRRGGKDDAQGSLF